MHHTNEYLAKKGRKLEAQGRHKVTTKAENTTIFLHLFEWNIFVIFVINCLYNQFAEIVDPNSFINIMVGFV